MCRVSRKVGLLKRRVRRSVFCEEIKNCTSLWRDQNVQKTSCPEHFLKLGCHKIWYAAAAKRAFASENLQNTSCLEHFWKLRCPKIVRGCGEKQNLKSKCSKHLMIGALFEVQMSKNGTPLWRKAHFQVKMYTSCSEHFLKLGCRKFARRCGAKHVHKSKC